MEKLLARWDRGVNCRSIIPSLPPSLPISIPPFLLSLIFPSSPHCLSFLAFSSLLKCSLSSLRSHFHPHLWPSTTHILNRLLLQSLCLIPPLSPPRTHSVFSFRVWNQWSNRWHRLWFMAHSERTLIRCRQGSLCCCLRLNDNGEPVALCSEASPLAFWTLQITSSSLIYGRHFGSWEGHEGEFGGEGVGCGFEGQHLHSANIIFKRNLVEVCFICIYVWVWKLMCVCGYGIYGSVCVYE